MSESSFFFFLKDPPTTEIYTLSLPDALPICRARTRRECRLVGARAARRSFRTRARDRPDGADRRVRRGRARHRAPRSEEHTSELQSRQYLVCRLLLEKKKKKSPLRACSRRTS